MPKRTDINKILLIGSGPIIIGQACEFDYSGTQACKALKEEGYKIVLVNSNPATIMTDPEFADSTYIEPITIEIVEKIIDKERPDALLPTMGGQTALNMAVALSEKGLLKKYNLELIGASYEAIHKAENREAFRQAMWRIGLKTPESFYARTIFEAEHALNLIGFPVIVRPSFTMGGAGGNIAYNREEFEDYVEWGLKASPVGEILVERSILGWKEYELEVMRDIKDNVVIVCSIENFDPMGIHTGDSITVAPAQTLTDKEYQVMRDAAIAIIREIGVDTGGSNIQFAVNPKDGDLVVIEMNPRVSRSSALASKATGFPIAKIAAKLAVGYTLDEIKNDITKVTPVSFEPTIDYVVVKIPRFAFEKFPNADATLTTQMKSVGEAMAIGRTFKESMQKGIRSLEIDSYGFEERIYERDITAEKKRDIIVEKLKTPNWERIWFVADAIRSGMGTDEIGSLTGIDSWFINNIREIVEMEEKIRVQGAGCRDHGEGIVDSTSLSLDSLAPDRLPPTPLYPLPPDLLRRAKEYGFSDVRIAGLIGKDEDQIRALRSGLKITPSYKRVDTCGAEFEAYTPYLYSTYESECESGPTNRKKVIILGGGPNRIGQGIEFDYCCVHGAFALREEGYETIMVNCNPETVSTDYDTSDRLYFEPLTKEDVLNIIDTERPDGVVIQFGGQTPLKLAVALERAGVKILGTPPDSIDMAEDRERFKALVDRLKLRQPESGIARSTDEAVSIAGKISYPLLVRPSYVLGGRAMEIVYSEDNLREYMIRAVKASPEHPVLIDKYLEDAIEVDVDAISDGFDTVIGGIMEHIEEAGVHSGDSACVLPPFSLDKGIIKEIRRQTYALSGGLNVVGLMNVQFAVKDSEVFILEVNPRASRTIPFVSKTTGIPLAKLAMKVMIGVRLKDLGISEERVIRHIAVKEAVFPFNKFKGVDTILGPEMKSTGEVMGIDDNFGSAFLKAQAAAGVLLPIKGRVFISVKESDKPKIVPAAKFLSAMGFSISATKGTALFLEGNGIEISSVNKVKEGRPHIVDHIKNGEIALIINTVGDKISQSDSYSIRRSAITESIPYFTTIGGANAAVKGIEAARSRGIDVKPLQGYHT